MLQIRIQTSKEQLPCFRQTVLICSSIGHFTSLCKKPRNSRHPQDNYWQSRTQQRKSSSHMHHSKLPSQSRQTCRRTSRSPSYTHNQYRHKGSPTPYRHEVSHISLSSPHPNKTEGRLLTDTASDGHTRFNTTLQIITKQSIKLITVKVDPGTDVKPYSFSTIKSYSGRILQRQDT